MVEGFSIASVNVFVSYSVVTAVVEGGHRKTVPIDQPLILNASSSRDYDVPPTQKSQLTYVWTCYISSINSFGLGCGFQNVYNITESLSSIASTNYSVVTIPSYQLKYNIT